MCSLIDQEFINVDSGTIFQIIDVKQEGSEPFVYYQSIWDEKQKESSSISTFITKIDQKEFAILPY